MARILNQIAGGVVEKYNDLTRDSAGVLTGPLNKLWRARIYLNRATSTLPKDTQIRERYTTQIILLDQELHQRIPK